MTDPRIPVLAALLSQGRAVHLATSILTLGAWGFSGGAGFLSLAAAIVWVVASWFAARVGLDAALFARLADGLNLNDMDDGLVDLGLVANTPNRPIDDRIEGARRLWRTQLLLAMVQGGLFGVAWFASTSS